MDIHPACLLMPKQSEQEFSALRESVRAGWNATHPIILYEGRILDGRHRYEACQAEGVEPTFTEWSGKAFDWNPYRFVRVEHDARRNWMSQEQRYLVLKDVLEREGVFDAERERIAAEANAKRAAAMAERTRNDDGTVASSTTTSGTTVKRDHQKGEKAKAAATGTNRGAVQRGDKLTKLAHQLGVPEVVEAVKAGDVKASAALKSLEEQAKAADLARPVSVELPEGLHRGDFRQLATCIPDNSVELVFTDPPYDAESLELYEAAAKEAARILKPGGSMIAYSGQRHLPEVYAAMSRHLRYWWTAACVHDGGNQMLQKLGIRCGWKPLVWYVKDTRGDVQNVIVDIVRGDREKAAHQWQQAQSEAEFFIEKLCPEGGTVVDFFMGGGTTMAAARAVGRRCIGFEVDAAAIERATERLSA